MSFANGASPRIHAQISLYKFLVDSLHRQTDLTDLPEYLFVVKTILFTDTWTALNTVFLSPGGNILLKTKRGG